MKVQTISKARRIIQWAIVIGVVGLMVFLVARLIISETTSRQTVTVGATVFRADVVSSGSARQKGLSGREDLGKREAMLFDFDTDGKWSIWMKDMNFPIDIIWIDKTGKVVHVEHDVAPETYPHRQFEPPRPARYVLEVAAGQARQSGVRPGIDAKFKLLEENNR